MKGKDRLGKSVVEVGLFYNVSK